MTSRSSCAAFSFTLSLILWHCVLTSAGDTNAPLPTSTLLPPQGNQQVRVGWVGNPKRRGTLTIIIECLTTIFACTWTVLHLNIPARTDTTMKRALRKVKWMAITILFPEFIFVKAVCELRFALYTLDMMYRSVQTSPEKFESVSKVHDARSFSVTRTWTVVFEPLQITLHKLLLRQAPLADSRDKLTRPETPQQCTLGPIYEYKEVQKWTLIHAYYVNMGGIVAQNQSLNEQMMGGPVVRGDHFADCTRNSWRLVHPLQELRLSVNEIMDRNKADWIVKTITIIQIGRLVLDLITRRVGGQPVTQLEIATASFAAFAMVTQLVNWWKPKDITQPTLINFVVDEESLYGRSAELFFAPRLWSPGRRPHGGADLTSHAPRDAEGDVEDITPHADTTVSSRIHVADDELWIDKSSLFLAWSLMIASCLVFGGIHCIAWIFWFPTRVEQLAWQTAALVTMLLPMIGWAGLYLLYLYRPRKHKETLAEAVEETINSFGADLLGADDDWWNTFTSAVNSKEWDEWIKEHPTTDKKDIKRLRGELETMGKLRSLLRDLWRSKQKGSRREHEEERIINTIWATERKLCGSRFETCALRDQYETWIKDQHEYLDGTLPPEDAVDSTANMSVWGFVGKLVGRQFQLPRRYRGKDYFQFREPGVGMFDWIFSRCEVINERSDTEYQEMWMDFDIRAQRQARFLNIVVAILYTVARLMLLAIMFSCLRAAPDGVYDTPDWIRFLPSFS